MATDNGGEEFVPTHVKKRCTCLVQAAGTYDGHLAANTPGVAASLTDPFCEAHGDAS